MSASNHRGFAKATPQAVVLAWALTIAACSSGGDTKPQIVTPKTGGQCDAMIPFHNTAFDASAALQACINQTADNASLALPIGVYTVASQIHIDRPVKLSTEGKSPSDVPCNAGNTTGCTELKAGADFATAPGLLLVSETAAGAAIDHLVIDGDRAHRQDSAAAKDCKEGKTGSGYNLAIRASNISFTNNVSKNALCGTGLEYSGLNSNARIEANSFAYNGVHDQKMLWADGLTVHNLVNSAIINNLFINNSDVDLIFGGCQNCTIQGNQIQHTGEFAGSAFAALMLHAWPGPGGTQGTTGNYTGSDISNNRVDCGPERACGFGLLIGGDPWYVTDTFGGSFHDNTVANAQQGLTIAHGRDMSVYNNTVSNSGGGTFKASCGKRQTDAYNISANSQNIDRAQERSAVTYSNTDWSGCILNW